MKIAIFSDNFFPEISGISDVIIATAKKMSILGHKINIYVPKYSKKNYKKVGLKRKEINISKNIKIIRLKSLPFPTGTGQGRIVIPYGSVIKKIKKFNPDIIHVHLPFGTGMEGLIASKLLKIPLVGTNHTPIEEYIKFAKKIIIKYNIWFYNQCDFVSSPGKTIFSKMNKYNFYAPHKVIYNPVDLPLKVFSKKEVKKFKDENNLSGFILLYVGRLAKEKNIDVIIKALPTIQKNIPNTTLVIVGKGTEEDNLKKLAKEKGVLDSVRFLGFKKGESLAKIYSLSDLFITMSQVETQSLAVMKASLYSKPIIVANFRGLKESVGNNNGFLVKLGDYKTLAKKVIYLYKNPNIRKSMGRNGRKFVSRFSPEKITKQWLKIYKQVIENYNKK